MGTPKAKQLTGHNRRALVNWLSVGHRATIKQRQRLGHYEVNLSSDVGADLVGGSRGYET